MRPDRSYLSEKLYQATSSLVDGEGGIKDRLHSAGLTLVMRGIDYAPDEFQPELASIIIQLTSNGAVQGDESHLEATIRTMTTDEAKKLAQRIFSLYTDVLYGGVPGLLYVKCYTSVSQVQHRWYMGVISPNKCSNCGKGRCEAWIVLAQSR